MSVEFARLGGSFSRYWLATAGMLLTLACGTAWTQAPSTSTVAGQVTDQQNAAVAGAEVKLIDTATNAALTTITNETGRYVFVNVSTGSFNVVFSKEGFSAFRVAAQQVGVGETLTVNATLTVGSTSTTVEVKATATAELQTTSATVGNTINQESILHLPNLGRDVQTLAVLQPGVTSSGYSAGSYMDQNTYMLDGGNTSSDMDGNTIGYQTNFTGLGGAQTSGYASGVV